MFAENKKSNSNTFSQQNTIAQGTTFNGDLISEGDFRIEGIVNGSLITSGKVVIGKTGSVEGVLTCENADVEGKFKGTLNVSDTLNLRSSAAHRRRCANRETIRGAWRNL